MKIFKRMSTGEDDYIQRLKVCNSTLYKIRLRANLPYRAIVSDKLYSVTRIDCTGAEPALFQPHIALGL